MQIIENRKIPTDCTSNHASNLLMLENGDLLCVWFGGSMEGSSDIYIYMARYDSLEKKWCKTIRMSDDKYRSEQNPLLFIDGSGVIWLLYTAQEKTDQGTSIIRCRKSFDKGLSWGNIDVLFSEPGAFIRHPPVFMDNNEWILPMFFSNKAKSFGDDYSAVQISRDNGNTWCKYIVPESNGLVHMNIIRIRDDLLISFFRSRRADNIYRSISLNGGYSWEPPTPLDLPNNNSSFQTCLLGDDRIGIVYNHNSSKQDPCESFVPPWISNKEDFLRSMDSEGSCAIWGVPRNPLQFAISEDMGLSWANHLVLESDKTKRSVNDKEGSFIGDYSYPSIIQSADGYIHISYTYLRDCIKYLRIDSNIS